MMTNSTGSTSIRPLVNPHPGVDLARTVRRLEDMRKKAGGKSRFSRGELQRALGFASEKRSGPAHTVIAAMMHFGLLKKTDSVYAYTDLAIKLFSSASTSSQRKQLLQEIVLVPELYSSLYRQYGTNLPSDISEKLVSTYRERNITYKNVGQVIKNYIASLDYAKLNHTHIKKDSLTNIGSSAPTDDDVYIHVSFRGTTVAIYKKYLLEAYQKTRDDELMKINRSLQ